MDSAETGKMSGDVPGGGQLLVSNPSGGVGAGRPVGAQFAAGRQPVMPGQVMAQPPVVSSGTGDIVLNNGSKKSRKPLIIAVVAVAVILVVAVIALVASGALGGGRNNSSNTTARVSGVQSYADYVINGDADNTEIGEGYSDEKFYYIQRVLFVDNEEWGGFYVTVSGELNDFAKNAEEDTDLADMIAEQQGLMEMFNVYNTLSGYDVDGLLTAYAEGNYAAVQTEISEQLSGLNIGVPYVEEYVTRMQDIVGAMSAVTNVYAGNGCAGGGGVEALELCALTTEDYDSLQAMLGEARVKYSELEYTVTSAVKYFIGAVYQFNDYGQGDDA